MAPQEIESCPSPFQSDARTSYAREPNKLGAGERYRTVVSAQATPRSTFELHPQTNKTGSDATTRTWNLLFQRESACQFAYIRRIKLGWPSWIRTRHSTFRKSRDAASLTANTCQKQKAPDLVRIRGFKKLRLVLYLPWTSDVRTLSGRLIGWRRETGYGLIKHKPKRMISCEHCCLQGIFCISLYDLVLVEISHSAAQKDGGEPRYRTALSHY